MVSEPTVVEPGPGVSEDVKLVAQADADEDPFGIAFTGQYFYLKVWAARVSRGQRVVCSDADGDLVVHYDAFVNLLPAAKQKQETERWFENTYVCT